MLFRLSRLPIPLFVCLGLLCLSTTTTALPVSNHDIHLRSTGTTAELDSRYMDLGARYASTAELAPRKGGGIADAVASAISGIVDLVKKKIAEKKANKANKKQRESYTQAIVNEFFQKDPSFNYIIMHGKHEVKFNGVEGVDWTHLRKDLNLNAGTGGTVQYDFYAVKSGDFWNQDHGGFDNWAFVGRWTRGKVGKENGHITFRAT